MLQIQVLFALKLNSFSFLVFCEYIYKVLLLRCLKINLNRYNSCWAAINLISA